MKQAISVSHGENFTHRILWISAQKQLELTNNTQQGYWYFALTTTMMAFFTYEAYLNFLGARIDSKTWANEREFFNKKPYRGVPGKFKKLIKCMEIDVPSDIDSIKNNVHSLSDIRDAIAHGKPHKFQTTIKHPIGQEPIRIKPWLEDLISRDKANIAMKNVDSLINFLHENALKIYGADIVEFSAFSPLTGFAIGSTDLSP